VTLLDTSAAIAYVQPGHTHHAAATARLRNSRLGLSGHAAVESLSVLTRLAPPQRLRGTDAVRLILTNFPDSRFLGAESMPALLVEFAERGIVGGSVYDGLVAAAAREHSLLLVTCDRRAVPTYAALGARHELLSP